MKNKVNNNNNNNNNVLTKIYMLNYSYKIYGGVE